MNPHVKYALVSLSIIHAAWLSGQRERFQLAFQYRGRAPKGLQEAIQNFSKENADAALVTSALLSWQMFEWYARS
jgi:hypothetical protein